jgi:hypothetical protein
MNYRISRVVADTWCYYCNIAQAMKGEHATLGTRKAQIELHGIENPM